MATGNVKNFVSFGGGGMAGVFAAGAIHSIAEAGVDLKEFNFSSTSVGTLNMINCILGNTENGFRIFSEFIESGAVNSSNTLPFLAYHFLSSKPSARQVMDVNRVMDVVGEHIGPRIGELRNHDKEVVVRLLSKETGKVRFADLRVNDKLAMKRLRRAVTFEPYCLDTSVVMPEDLTKEDDEIDAGIDGYFGFEEFFATFPNARVAYFSNVTLESLTSMKESFRRHVLAKGSKNRDLARLYDQYAIKTRRDRVFAEAHPDRVCIIEPSANFPVRLLTSDKGKLEAGYAEGRDKKHLDKFEKFFSL